MKTKWMLCVAIILFVCSLCSAEMCERLKAVSCGEVHSLAITDDNSLLACGGNSYIPYVLGLGQNVSQSLTLQRVKGINGVGFLKNVAVFDAGWTHIIYGIIQL